MVYHINYYKILATQPKCLRFIISVAVTGLRQKLLMKFSESSDTNRKKNLVVSENL